MRAKKNFRTRISDRKLAFLLDLNRRRPEGTRQSPVVIKLPVMAGHEGRDKPPVRIFIGTEPAQHRAELVLVWSIVQARDPSRAYEIHLMKDLKGYDRRKWKTGFSRYRYAIPALAGETGRAIYNDVDQIYLADPALLFDLDMGGAGVLCVSHRDTSVMLIDCERMASVWKAADAEAGGRHLYFNKQLHDAGLWGQLPPEWNARDQEYDPAKSKLFHFTTLQTQPWRPFPELIKYREHPNEDVWLSMEQAAEASGFTIFTKDNPSARYQELLEQYRLMHGKGAKENGYDADRTFDGRPLSEHVQRIARLIAESKAGTLLDYGCGKGALYTAPEGEPPESRIRSMPGWGQVRVTCYDPVYEPFAAPYEGKFDGVICTDVLEHITDEDVAWVVDEMFRSANKFVYVAVACYPAAKNLPNGENAHCTVRPPAWWCQQLSAASRRSPGVRWILCTQTRARRGTRDQVFDSESSDLRSAA